jgi:hypothetical protein
MKRSIPIFILLILLSCKTTQQDQNQQYNLDWIIGKWERVETESGESGYEVWSMNADEDLVGEGFMIREHDMAFTEFLKILMIEGKKVYQVRMPSGEVTDFIFTRQSKTGFICENPLNDFPKMIVYELNGNKMNVIISAGQKSKIFHFIKLDNGN